MNGPGRRHCLMVSAASSNEGDKLDSIPNSVKKPNQSLEDRIASGEFDDSGSTKERMTRPLRKVLAKDPLGIGEHAAALLTHALVH